MTAVDTVDVRIVDSLASEAVDAGFFSLPDSIDPGPPHCQTVSGLHHADSPHHTSVVLGPTDALEQWEQGKPRERERSVRLRRTQHLERASGVAQR